MPVWGSGLNLKPWLEDFGHNHSSHGTNSTSSMDPWSKSAFRFVKDTLVNYKTIHQNTPGRSDFLSFSWFWLMCIWVVYPVVSVYYALHGSCIMVFYELFQTPAPGPGSPLCEWFVCIPHQLRAIQVHDWFHPHIEFSCFFFYLLVFVNYFNTNYSFETLCIPILKEWQLHNFAKGNIENIWLWTFWKFITACRSYSQLPNKCFNIFIAYSSQLLEWFMTTVNGLSKNWPWIIVTADYTFHQKKCTLILPSSPGDPGSLTLT